ncbi:MAG: hypothetical protein E7621_06475 [Ruminococcaceae bacterium]|nr:hypothetical protein [Oscillospiraceae bacterium]
MYSRDDLKKLSNISDEVLKEKIITAINASGKNPADVDLSSENLEKLKKTIFNLSDEDLQKILSSVPPEKLAEIKNKLSEDKKVN